MRCKLNKLVLGLCFLTHIVAQEEAVEQAEQPQEVEMALDAVDIVEAGAFWGNEGMPSKNVMMAAKRLEVLNLVEMEINELKSVVELDEASEKKLRIAAKALTGKRVKSWAETMAQFEIWGPEATSEADVAAEEKKIKELTLRKVDPTTLQWLDTAAMTGAPEESLVENKIWIKAVKSVIGEDGYQKMLVRRQEREAAKKKAIVEFFVQVYGEQLKLNDEQLEKFTDLLDRKFEVSKMPVTSLDATYNYLYALASISQDELKVFLRPAQMVRWQVMFGAYAGWNPFDDDVLVEEIDVLPADEQAEDTEAQATETAEGGDGD